MYILNSQKQLIRLNGNALSIYNHILDTLLSSNTYPPALREYINSAYHTLKQYRRECIEEISSRLTSSLKIVTNSLHARPAKTYLKKDMLQWGLFFAGEILSRQNLAFEHQLAKQVMTKKDIKQNLNNACHKAYRLALRESPAFLRSVTASFDTYNFFLIPYTSAQVLKKPENFDLHQCICALHALNEHLGKVRPVFLYLPEKLARGSIGNKTRALLKRSDIVINIPCKRSIHVFGSLSSINELSPFVIGPRMYNMPTDLPSFTTSRMLMLVKKSGGTMEELRAVSYALFAFWTLRYWNNITDVHHYHSIMDMSANFGLPYRSFTYQDITDDLAKENAFQHQNMDSTLSQRTAVQMYRELLQVILLLPYYLINLSQQAVLQIADNRAICFPIMFIAITLLLNEALAHYASTYTYEEKLTSSMS